jgi:hypothetical protein
MPLRVTTKQAKLYQLTLDGGAEEVKRRRPHRQIELALQGLLFDHIKDMTPTYPALEWIFATLSGVYIPPALLAPIARAGLKRGILDIWVIVPRYREEEKRWIPGKVIDLKTTEGRPTKEQKAWAAYLRECGWEVDIIVGAWRTWQGIAGYIGIQGEDYEARDLRRQEETALRLMGR